MEALTIALVVWFALTALSVIYVAYDAFRRTPEMPVMKWGWVLVTLYLGPVGGALYVLSCQEPRPDSHEEFVRPLWKQALGSNIHCLAGDATGIIIAAAITMALGLEMWQDVIAEYLFGFAFGLLIFQALFMRDMVGGSYMRALRMSLLPEWISMNAVMAGMVPVMVVLMSRDMRAMEPSSLRFWGVMSLASLAGFAIAYPVNVWLVAAGLKHGMGTVRALGAGGHSLAAEQTRANVSQPAPESPTPATGAHLQHGTTAITAAPSAALGQPMAMPMPVAEPSPIAPVAPAGSSSMAMAMPMPPTGAGARVAGATAPQITAVTLLSLLALGAGVLIAALGGDLRMSGRMAEHAGVDAPPNRAPMNMRDSAGAAHGGMRMP